MKNPLSFQYWLEDGSFAGHSSGWKTPPKDEHLQKGKGQVILDDHPLDANGAPLHLPSLRFNKETGKVEPCSKYARMMEREKIFAKHRDLSPKRERAMAKAILTGDKGDLQAIEEQASALDKQLDALPPL